MEAAYVSYLGEAHMFLRPEHQVDYLCRMLAWFDHHLRPAALTGTVVGLEQIWRNAAAYRRRIRQDIRNPMAVGRPDAASAPGRRRPGGE